VLEEETLKTAQEKRKKKNHKVKPSVC
jgi:hypothetical protein